ncbi:hypothetical protein [Halococcus sp. AFM35]|uniref:hypothetical protein n=1 Tax=Halococcus sp. AFM35 TaxID=3421653 RepID=UPI003EBD9855
MQQTTLIDDQTTTDDTTTTSASTTARESSTNARTMLAPADQRGGDAAVSGASPQQVRSSPQYVGARIE